MLTIIDPNLTPERFTSEKIVRLDGLEKELEHL